MALDASALVSVYHELVSHPRPTEAGIKLLGDSVQINAKWSQRNLEENKMNSFLSSYLVDRDGKVQNLATTDVTSELIARFSPSGKLKCVVQSVPDGEKKKQLMKIWDISGRLLKTFDLTALDLHGDVYPFGVFGSMEWSENERQIIYVAEKKRLKTAPFFSTKPKKTDAADETAYGDEFLLVENWGEQMTEQSQSVVVLLDVETGPRVLDGIPEKYCPGEVTWNKNGDGVFGVVYESLPRRLGLIYCTNREGHVFHLNLNGEFRVFTAPGVSPRSIRLSPNGETLIWLERLAGGPHNGCHSLKKFNTTRGELSEVIPVFQKGSFGLYNQLPLRCFAADNLILFDTISQATSVIFSVDLESGKVTERCKGELLDVFSDYFLFTKARPNFFPQLCLGLKEQELEISLGQKIDEIEFTEEILNFPVENVDFDLFSVILVRPETKKDGKLPLIVFPHGGPHSANFTTFMLEPAFFAKIGFAVLLINYRGSLGMGDASVKSLLGKIGTLDVGDVEKAVNWVLNKYDDIDGEKLIAYGGSHGGFLSLQLAGQFPGVYKCVVVRNPVVDLPSMFATSDIPDWISTEIGCLYEPGKLPTAEETAKMTEMSPIRWIEAYKAPTLFLLGSKDERVPMTQSIYYQRLLKARGIKTKVHVYPDNHALGSVGVHLDTVINSTLWIYQALNA